RLLRGHIGRAGHLGHSSLDPDGPPDCAGTPGSLEVSIGNCTIQERSGGRFHATHELIAAHLKGDAEASAIWLKSVKALAAGVCWRRLFRSWPRAAPNRRCRRWRPCSRAWRARLKRRATTIARSISVTATRAPK